MTFEILKDYKEVQDIFVHHGGTVPSPEMSTIIVARDDASAIAGLSTLQLIYHGGPLWVHPTYRGQKLGYTLFDKLDEHCAKYLPGMVYYNFPVNPAIDRILEKRGHHKKDVTVWESKRF